MSDNYGNEDSISMSVPYVQLINNFLEKQSCTKNTSGIYLYIYPQNKNRQNITMGSAKQFRE